MNKSVSSFRNAANVGVTVAIVTLFIMLIGFNSVLASIFSDLAGQSVLSGELPNPVYQIAVVGLLALWCGVQSTKEKRPVALLQALMAGSLAGLIIAIFSLVIGVVYEHGADFRYYMDALSPADVKFLLFDQSAVLGALIHFALFTGFSFLGGAIRLVDFRALFKRPSAAVTPTFQKVSRLVSSNRYAQWGLWLLVALATIFLPRWWGSYWNYVFGTVGIYVIMGIGLNIIVGLSGQLVLGYVAFFAVGAYTAGVLNSPHYSLMWGFWVAIVLGVLLAALGGILVGLPTMRLRGDYLAIVTLGFGEIIRILLNSDMLASLTGGPNGIQDIRGPTFFGIPLSSDVDFMYLIGIGVILSVFIANRLQRSRVGRAWVSIREDETVAAASGVDTQRYKLMALAIGAAFAGLAGVLFATRNQFTGPGDHTLMVSINVLSIVIVGGMGSIPGMFLGSFALKGLPELLREFANYRLLAFGALLVVMMIIRPQGFWPASTPKMADQAKSLSTDTAPPENSSKAADEKEESHDAQH
jgi:branched-chain amino acid transport system permease protein